MFDPYHRWLGIPPGQRPPTCYQLLGITPTEADPEVIKEAALRQTAHVRTYQTGPRGEECTRLLNEIAQARATLLNPATRREYDDRLARETPAPPSPAPSPAPVAAPVAAPAPGLASWESFAELGSPRRRRGTAPWWADLSVLAYVLLLLLVGTGAFWVTRHGIPKIQPGPAEQPRREGRPAR